MGRAAAMLTSPLEPPSPTGALAVQSIFTLTGTLPKAYCKIDCLYVLPDYGLEEGKKKKKEHFYFIS